MPRRNPTDERGAVHHVMVRRVDGRALFRDDDDRGAYLDRFEQLACDLRFGCDALTMIENHVHGVIQTGDTPLWKLMHRLSFWYAQRFNRTSGRRGYLLEARYKAKRVLDDAGHVAVVAYAIGNPLRHRVVSHFEALIEDRWNAMSFLAGRRPPRKFECASRLAALLGRDPEESIQRTCLAADAEEASLEPDRLAELEYFIVEMCVRHGVPRATLRRPEHRKLCRELLRHATTTLRVPAARASREIGLSPWAAYRALRRPE